MDEPKQADRRETDEVHRQAYNVAFEELGLSVTVGRLLAVNWLPPWRGWDDALLYLFDLGVHHAGELDPALFLRREIAGAHWRSIADAAAHVAPYTARMLEVAADAEHPLYLENSEPGRTRRRSPTTRAAWRSRSSARSFW